MNIIFVSVESGIAAMGFRKIAAIARQVEPSTEICFITTDNLYSLSSHFFPDKDFSIQESDLSRIAGYLAKADLVAFSCMTASAKYVEQMAVKIKNLNPRTFLLWGGVHPTLYADEAIAFVDAICVGEGETPLKMFLETWVKGERTDQIPNMWFRKGDRITRNASLPLNTPADLSRHPHSYQQSDCFIYDLKENGFRPFNKFDYTTFNGLLFRTLWTLGCPFSCAYCANDSFIKMDSGYSKLRFPTVDYMIEEIVRARKAHPYISTIAFYDDNFIALPEEVIIDFCDKYKQKINLPFVVFGIHPNLITREKIERLAAAGMNRARMGIQSGAEQTLKFYCRNTTTARITAAAAILAEATAKYHMIAPAYDIISDNPFETPEGVIETLQMMYALKRPFTITLFSLRIFPKTKLFDYMQEHPQYLEYFKGNSYLDTRKTLSNITLYLLGTFKPPAFLFHALISAIRQENDKPHEHAWLFWVVKFFYLVKRGVDHMLHFDFSTVVGSWTYYIWKFRRTSARR